MGQLRKMCGIAGFLGLKSQTSESKVKGMLGSLVHRGPDEEDIWINQKIGIALGHRRLSIIDLLPSGRQPMMSACQRYVIAFNGEIYNWPEIKSALELSGKAPKWRGTSDTEVFLAAITAWGLSGSLKRIRGMFAFALWDISENRLMLVRDRIGEKPLYYGQLEGKFCFASELKAIVSFANTPLEREPEAVALMVRYGYVPEPYSIYKNIFKMPPGTIISVAANGQIENIETYWSFSNFVSTQQKASVRLSDEEAVNNLEYLMGCAVKEQMVADVPLGAFLSGGIDSSIVVALMQANSQQPVKTFSAGFEESAYNEADYARKIAKHLGTEHTELFITSKQSFDIIPSLSEMYDEPFADASQIPTALISRLTRKHVKVCLSGDAGDELFGGYNRYFWTNSIWNILSKIPVSMRKPLGQLLQNLPVEVVNAICSCLNPVFPKHFRVSNPGDKLQKFSQILPAETQEQLYHYLLCQWRGDLPIKDINEPPTYLTQPERWPALGNFSERMMAVDTQNYLPQDILVKVDRAAMASSLETRLPFLDLRLLEFAWQLPLGQKIRDGNGKWVVKELLSKYVPKNLFDRPKQGFAVPIEHWLRGPLREWAEDLLKAEKLSADGFDPIPIRYLWTQHLKGQNHQYALWNIITYRAWSDRWL